MSIIDSCNKKNSNPKKYEDFFHETQKFSEGRPEQKLNLAECESSLTLAYCKEQVQRIKGIVEGYQAGYEATQSSGKTEQKRTENSQQR